MAASRFPLRTTTPEAWADAALADPLALLNDHAHLERKAASCALELLHRWPEPNPPEHWVRAMTTIARDEVEHLAIVCRLLARRGGRLTRHHRCEYARALRARVRVGRGPQELVDRLLVASLIEARSGERFAVLGRRCEDEELARLYRDLEVADYGHYRVYVDLASYVATKPGVKERWDEFLDAEAEILTQQRPGPRIHSGVA